MPLSSESSFPSPTDSPHPPPSLKKIDPRRFYSAFIFIPILYMVIRYSPPWLFALSLAATILIALWEFLDLYFGSDSSLLAKILSSVGAICLLFFMYLGHNFTTKAWLPAIILIILAGFLISPRTMKRYFPTWATYLFAILYITWLLGHFILLRQLDHGVEMVFFVLLVTWLGDTGGYVAGLSLGKSLLAPTLSPKKTIEGLVGGILFSVLGGIISHVWYFPYFSLTQCGLLGGALALIGALGDLGESAIKRSVHAKDSGTIIPGHGGVLDRVDSLLLTAPAFYYYTLSPHLPNA